MSDDDLSGTHWRCNNLKTSFLSEAFQRYQSLSEEMTYTFTSDSSFNIREFITVTDKNGDIDKAEATYYGEYKIYDNKLKLIIEKARLLKSHKDKTINNDYHEYDGIEIEYAIYLTKRNLYFYSPAKSEIFNMICKKI
ncbi:hypothetical protein [Vibrio vulnificus]|uniref:hypothetical protein n=1 Tax=Vibrio vulnificus TaxID=672 RepID=UPI00102A3275|nr:hypothetical protein [Vibrio vulnificus]